MRENTSFTMTDLLFFFAVILLDTTIEPSLDWTRYPYGPQAGTPGVSNQKQLSNFAPQKKPQT